MTRFLSGISWTPYLRVPWRLSRLNKPHPTRPRVHSCHSDWPRWTPSRTMTARLLPTQALLNPVHSNSVCVCVCVYVCYLPIITIIHRNYFRFSLSLALILLFCSNQFLLILYILYIPLSISPSLTHFLHLSLLQLLTNYTATTV